MKYVFKEIDQRIVTELWVRTVYYRNSTPKLLRKFVFGWSVKRMIVIRGSVNLTFVTLVKMRGLWYLSIN